MPKITEMFAFIMADTDENDEGVPAFTRGGLVYPMTGADLKRVASLRGIAQDMANQRQKEVVVRRFALAEILEVILPEKPS